MENDGSYQVPERFGVVLVVFWKVRELLALLMMVLLLEIMRSFPGNNVLPVLGREGVPLPFVSLLKGVNFISD